MGNYKNMGKLDGSTTMISILVNSQTKVSKIIPTIFRYINANLTNELKICDIQDRLEQDWNHGTRLVNDGKKRIRNAEARIDIEETNIKRERQEIAQGGKDIAKGEKIKYESENYFKQQKLG